MKKKHSSEKKSKSRRTGTKSPNHGKTPIKTQEKNSENRVKRPGSEKEEVVLRHTESKRVRLEEEVKPIEPKEVSPSTKVESSLLEEKKDYELPCEEVKKKKEREQGQEQYIDGKLFGAKCSFSLCVVNDFSIFQFCVVERK